MLYDDALEYLLAELLTLLMSNTRIKELSKHCLMCFITFADVSNFQL